VTLEQGTHGGSHPADGAAEDCGELLAVVSHELNTPLTVITGYAELLAVRDDDHTRREAATRIPGSRGDAQIGDRRHARRILRRRGRAGASLPRASAEVARKAVDLLTKPFSPLQLLGSVERLLAKDAPNQTA
jgi:signal transduction histidine kinase